MLTTFFKTSDVNQQSTFSISASSIQNSLVCHGFKMSDEEEDCFEMISLLFTTLLKEVSQLKKSSSDSFNWQQGLNRGFSSWFSSGSSLNRVQSSPSELTGPNEFQQLSPATALQSSLPLTRQLSSNSSLCLPVRSPFEGSFRSQLKCTACLHKVKTYICWVISAHLESRGSCTAHFSHFWGHSMLSGPISGNIPTSPSSIQITFYQLLHIHFN